MSRFGEGNGTPLQYSCLENAMDRGAWWAVLHGVAKSRTQLSDFTFTFHFQALKKEMATHSSVLAWRIPGTGEPGGLPSVGSQRVRHNWSDLAAAAADTSQLRESLSYRWRVNHLWSKGRTNCKSPVNPQAEEFSFHKCKNRSSKNNWTRILCKAIRI